MFTIRGKLATFKGKLFAILLTSLIVRVFAYILLPRQASHLAPDEGVYSRLTDVIASGKPVDTSPFGESIYLISRAFILPASMSTRIGFSSLDSVRLISTLYGFLVVAVVAFFLLRLSRKKRGVRNFIYHNEAKVLSLFAVFVFLPSHFIWSTVGIRESATEFWVIVVFALVFYVYEVKTQISKFALLGVLLTIPLIFSSRPQVGWLVGVTLLIYSFIRVRTALIVVPFILVGIVLGYAVSNGFSIVKVETLVPHEKLLKSNSPSGTRPAVTSDKGVRSCKFEGQEIILSGVQYVCFKEVRKTISGLKNPGVALIDQTDGIPERSEANKVDASSAIKTISCPRSGSSRLDDYFCIAYRAPYTTYTFLVRPTLGADVTSSSSLFAAIENTFWLGAFLFVILVFIRNRRLAFLGALTPSLLFFSLYSVGAGAYEGNMGTAFRHKSLILWVVILLLASTIAATQQRKAEQQEISGSSQE